MLKELTCYIDGLVTMASSLSKKISYSSISATCFKNKNFKEEFFKYYKVKLEGVKFSKIKDPLEKIFSLYLEDDIVNNLLNLLKKDLGEEKELLTINNNDVLEKLSCFNGGKEPFYFIENLYIVKYNEYIVCFIVGNNT